jgi:hypothetical protein
VTGGPSFFAAAMPALAAGDDASTLWVCVWAVRVVDAPALVEALTVVLLELLPPQAPSTRAADPAASSDVAHLDFPIDTLLV